MNILGREFLNNTDGGLQIFRKYLEHTFVVNEPTILGDRKFTVAWNDRYDNYAIYVSCLENGKWQTTNRLNAIWFVKEKFGLTEEETYSKINREMNLGILQEEQPKVVAPTKRPPIPFI